MPKDLELVAVISVETIFGANPEKTLAILNEAVHHPLGKPTSGRNGFQRERLRYPLAQPE
jgi:hypothetical protein